MRRDLNQQCLFIHPWVMLKSVITAILHLFRAHTDQSFYTFQTFH